MPEKPRLVPELRRQVTRQSYDAPPAIEGDRFALHLVLPIILLAAAVLLPAAAVLLLPAGSAAKEHAAGDAQGTLGVTLRSGGVPPLISVGLQGEQLGFGVEGIAATHELLGTEAHSRLILGIVRYRAPVALQGWAPWVDGGIVSAASLVEGVDLQASGPTVGAGVEGSLDAGGSWFLRAELRWLQLLDENYVTAGISLGRRWALPEPELREPDPEEQAEAERLQAAARAVSAQGRVTGVSLPFSVSGTWSASADLMRGSASLSLQGTADGEEGSISFSSERRAASFDGRTLVLTFRETATHEGMSVDATVTARITEARLSVRVSARRSDGLSASATLRGTTSAFAVDTGED